MKIIKSLTTVVVVISILIIGCKQKDADIKIAVEKSLASMSVLTNTSAEAKEGIVTLSGQASDETARTLATTTAQAVKGVKSVINQITVTQTTSPTISIDEVLIKNVNDAVKDYPTVVASVKDGIVSLQGTIEKTNLSKLLMSISTLKPKKIDNKLTIK